MKDCEYLLEDQDVRNAAIRLWSDVYASFYAKHHRPQLAKQAADNAVAALLVTFREWDE